MNKVLITTAIDYVNDVLHLGHAYQKVAADVLVRYLKLIGHKTYFVTGTDENGSKAEEAAKAAGVSPQEFVDKISEADKKEQGILNISFDRFIRTTDEDHKKLVKEFWKKVKKNGDIYLGDFEGLYCVGCEEFKTQTDLTSEEKCPLHPNQKLQKVVEKNYFFRWSKYQDFLIDFLEKNPDFIYPAGRQKEILAFAKSGIKDISISRQSVKWGIPVPNDPEHVIYVWFDALINYLTAGLKVGFWDEQTEIIHILGKDNLRWHALLWPAMLKSAGYPLPKKILVNGFISINGQKISKSLGNVIRPSELVKEFGADAARYYLLRYTVFGEDSDFSKDKLKNAYNADLANGLGNLVARVAKLCEKAGFAEQQKDLKIDGEKFEEFNKYLESYQFHDALSFVWKKISEADKFVDKEQPWTLKGKELEKVLNHLVQEIREVSLLLEPFLPDTSKKIKEQFTGPEIKSQPPLFPRLP